jgi:hypothetical protein
LKKGKKIKVGKNKKIRKIRKKMEKNGGRKNRREKTTDI